MKFLPMTTCVSSILLAAFLAIQVSPLWATTNNVKDIDVIVKKKPGGPSFHGLTDGNGNFSIHVDGAGTYEITAAGGTGLTAGASVKLSFSVQSEKPAAANSRQAVRTAAAVVDASGGLAFSGDIRVSEAAVLTGILEIVGTPAPATEQGPVKTRVRK